MAVFVIWLVQVSTTDFGQVHNELRKVAKFNHKLSDYGSQYRAFGKGLFKGKGHYRLKGIVKWIRGTC